MAPFAAEVESVDAPIVPLIDDPVYAHSYDQIRLKLISYKQKSNSIQVLGNLIQ